MRRHTSERPLQHTTNRAIKLKICFQMTPSSVGKIFIQTQIQLLNCLISKPELEIWVKKNKITIECFIEKEKTKNLFM